MWASSAAVRWALSHAVVGCTPVSSGVSRWFHSPVWLLAAGLVSGSRQGQLLSAPHHLSACCREAQSSHGFLRVPKSGTRGRTPRASTCRVTARGTFVSAPLARDTVSVRGT